MTSGGILIIGKDQINFTKNSQSPRGLNLNNL